MRQAFTFIESFFIISISLLIISCKSDKTVKEINSESLTKFEIVVSEENNIDSIILELTDLQLPNFKAEKLSESKLNLFFTADFDTISMISLFEINTIQFQETYNFERFISAFEPIITELAKLGSKNAQTYLEFENESSKNPDKIMQVPYFGGSKIGTFSVNDTLEIMKLVSKAEIIEKLPKDLIFNWSGFENSDSVSLFLLKENSIENGLNEKNIIQLDMNLKEREEATEFNEKGIPTEWKTTSYYEITMLFDASGAEKIYELTNRNIGEFIAIKINNETFSAPRVTMPIESGKVSLSIDKNGMIEFFESILFNRHKGQIRIENIFL